MEIRNHKTLTEYFNAVMALMVEYKGYPSVEDAAKNFATSLTLALALHGNGSNIVTSEIFLAGLRGAVDRFADTEWKNTNNFDRVIFDKKEMADLVLPYFDEDMIRDIRFE